MAQVDHTASHTSPQATGKMDTAQGNLGEVTKDVEVAHIAYCVP